MLCRLTCASLKEDRYGVVQRDIPKIIEALLSFLGALEEYQAELNKKYALPPPEELKDLSAKDIAEKEALAMEAARASEVVGVVGDGESHMQRASDESAMTALLTPSSYVSQPSRTELCRSCGHSERSFPPSGSRRGSRRSCKASWTTTEATCGWTYLCPVYVCVVPCGGGLRILKNVLLAYRP